MTRRSPGRVEALLRCGSIRFAAFYFLPFFAMLARNGRGRVAWAVAAAVYWSLESLGTELLNRLADRVEDGVNRPERTALCHRVGFGVIAPVGVAAWAAVAGLDLVWIALHPSLGVAVLAVLAIVFGIGYSYGPRLKRNRYASLFVLTFPFSGTLLTGWALGGPTAPANRGSDFWSSALPLAIFLGLAIGSLAGVKDITDIIGDARISYRSLWVELVGSRSGLLVDTLLTVPFIALTVFVASHLLPVRMLWLLLFAPCCWVLALWVRRAASPLEREATREVAYQYWLCFMSASLLLYAPTRPLLIATLAAAAYWALTTRYLHWSDGFSAPKQRALLAMLRSPAATKIADHP